MAERSTVTAARVLVGSAAGGGEIARAAVLAAPGRFEQIALERGEPAEDDVLVSVLGCGICGSSLPAWEGRPWFSYPLPAGAPGHEAWGVVDAVGPEVVALSPGDRVALLGDRALATHVVAPQDDVVALPPGLPEDFPGEPLGCAMNVFARAGVEPGDHVAVVGTGFLGALIVQLSARAGADVVTISKRAFALELGLAMGASRAVSVDDDAALGTSEGAFDRVFEMAGLQRTLDVASGLVRVRGRLIVGGYHQDGPRTVDMQSWNWRGIDVVNAHERDPARYREGILAAAAAVLDGRLDPTPLYTHRFPLEQAGEAFEMLRTRPDGFVKALVTP